MQVAPSLVDDLMQVEALALNVSSERPGDSSSASAAVLAPAIVERPSLVDDLMQAEALALNVS
jgi:hypothetical protein